MNRKKNNAGVLVRRVVALIVVVVFLTAPLSPTLSIQKAEALDGGGSLALELKEYGLDVIAWMVINDAINKLTSDIVNWINTGFEGSPAYLQDLDGLLLDAANDQVGNFIYGSELGFLCSPFQLEVQTALFLEFKRAQEFDVQCTLTDIVENVEGFMGGDFLAGGWDGWYQVTQNPRNNPYGAFVLGYEEASVRVTNARNEQLTLLDFGKGFLTLQECEEYTVPNPHGDGERTQTECKDTTPGTVIEDRLNEALGNGEKRLQVADEINEMVAALLSQLARSALDGLANINAEGVRNAEGGYVGYAHGQEKRDRSCEVEIALTTTCNEEGTTCDSDGTITVTVPGDGVREICGIKGDPSNCQTINDLGSSGGGSCPGDGSSSDGGGGFGTPENPIKVGPFGEPHPT